MKTVLSYVAALILLAPMAFANISTCFKDATASRLPTKIIYVDPASKSTIADGSRKHPFRSLAKLLAPATTPLVFNMAVKARDGTISTKVANAKATIKGPVTLMLASGDYGVINIRNILHPELLAIEAMENAVAKADRVVVSMSRNIMVKGLQVIAKDPIKNEALIQVGNGFLGATSNVRIHKNVLKGAASTKYYKPEDWLAMRTTGVSVRDATCTEVYGNRIEDVRFGIGMAGPKASITYNTIQRFAEDGIRFMESDLTIRGNTIRDGRNTPIDNGHHDGMQGFPQSPAGIPMNQLTVKNVIIDRNTVTNISKPGYDAMQGISYFDGKWKNVKFTNNLVYTDAYHGMNLNGGDGVLVANNTVLGTSLDPSAYTWLRFGSKTDGTKSTNVKVVNNITSMLKLPIDLVMAKNNLVTKRFGVYQNGKWFRGNSGAKIGTNVKVAESDVFVDAAKGDFRPKSGGPADGTALKAEATDQDLNGVKRDALKPDIGALEF